MIHARWRWYACTLALAPGILALLAVIAVGQFQSGDAYGALAHMPWSIFLWGDWRHSVQLYDALAAAAGFVLLWRIRFKLTREGLVFWSAVAWYSAARVLIEAFRGDGTVLPGGYRIVQVIAWFGLIVSLWMMRPGLVADEGKQNA